MSFVQRHLVIMMRCHRNLPLDAIKDSTVNWFPYTLFCCSSKSLSENINGRRTVPRDFATITIPLILTTSHTGRYCYPNSEIRNGFKEIGGFALGHYMAM